MKIWIFAFLIFFFTFGLRLWNINLVGRWWDEQWYAEKSYHFIELLKKGDLANSFWYKDGADHPPLTSYFYGLVSYTDLIRYDPQAKPALVVSTLPKGAPVFPYDLTNMRLLSAFLSSLAVVLIFLFGVRFLSLFVGVTSAMILAMLPHLLGVSQLITLESWIITFFTAGVFSYLLYLETGKKKYLYLTGILTGFNLMIKQSNILLFVFFIAAFFIWKITMKKKNISYSHFFILTVIALLVSVLIWPMPLLALPQFLSISYDLWFNNRGLIPELIFGIHMGARWFFYPIAFLVTTPAIVLFMSFVGIYTVFKQKKKWIYLSILLWFLVPFLMMFFHHRQNMVRYIIQFYAPLSLLAAIGFEATITNFTKNRYVKYYLLIPFFVYLMLILVKVTPFYLNYFNELVGGTKTVYEKQLFFLGWFGEGLRDPGIYLAKHAKTGAKIGMAVNPEITLYKVPNLQYETFNAKHTYDYVVVNYFNTIRLGFNEKILKKEYELVYTEKADGADLAHVYKYK